MITILQIIFGQIPPYLLPCVNSVKDYAYKNNYDYKVISSYSDYFIEPEFKNLNEKFLWLRHVSDWIRTKELSENLKTLYIDWDVYIFQDFKISDINKHCFAKNEYIDSLMYNGDDLNVFKNIHEAIETPNLSRKYNLSVILRRYCRENIVPRFEGHYVHLDNCRLMKEVFDLYYE
jgi:hypothetical protein